MLLLEHKPDYSKEFMTYLLANGYSVAYHRHVSVYLNFVSQQGLDILNITYKDLTEFMSHIREKGMATGTINNKIKTLKVFYRFMMAAYGCSPKILEAVGQFKLKNPEVRLKEFLEPDEFRKFKGYIETFEKQRKYSDRTRFFKHIAILDFMYYTGLRMSSIVNLKRADFDLDKRCAIIRLPTKGGFEYQAKFPEEVRDEIKTYFSLEEEKKNAFNLTQNRVEYLCGTKYRKYVPHNKKLTTHSFRYSFANILMEGGIPLPVMKALMGHSSIESTLRYMQPSQKTVAKMYDSNIKFHGAGTVS